MPKTTEATVVDEPREFTITKMQPGTAIEANFPEIEAKIAEIVEMYSGAIVTLDYLPQAKKDRAYLNGLVKSVDQRRIEAKNTYLAPYNAFEAEVKRLLAPVKDASAAIDLQVKELEEQEKGEKRAELVEFYEALAGILLEAVPFERIEDPAWLNKSVNIGKAKKDIEERVDKIAQDFTTLEELDLPHLIEAKAEFFATLDLSRAIARSKTLQEQVAAAERLEAQRAEMEAERKAAVPAPVEEPVEAPVSVPPVSTPADDLPVSFTLHVTCTRAQFDGLLEYVREHGIQGKAVRS